MHRFCEINRFTDPYRDHDYGSDGYPGEFVYGDDIYVDDYYMSELWKPIIGFEGEYWVSDMARVWSVRNKQFLKIKPMDRQGHLGVCLYSNGRRYYRYIHRLVAESFIPNPHRYPIVRHMDDVRDYNTVADIEWGTQIDNMRDSRRNGHFYILREEDRQRGIDMTRTPIKAIDLETGKELYFKSQGEAGRVLGIPQANIWKVLNHQRPRAQGYAFEYVRREDEPNEWCY